MYMNKVLVILSVALLLFSCNKNQSAVKKLDGTWKATKYKVTEDGVSADLIATGWINSLTAIFDGCKLKEDEFCNVTTTVDTDFGNETDTGLYTVVSDGTELQMKDDPSSTTIHTIEIVELTKTTLKTKDTDEEGTVTEVTYEKQ